MAEPAAPVPKPQLSDETPASPPSEQTSELSAPPKVIDESQTSSTLDSPAPAPPAEESVQPAAANSAKTKPRRVVAIAEVLKRAKQAEAERQAEVERQAEAERQVMAEKESQMTPSAPSEPEEPASPKQQEEILSPTTSSAYRPPKMIPLIPLSPTHDPALDTEQEETPAEPIGIPLSPSPQETIIPLSPTQNPLLQSGAGDEGQTPVPCIIPLSPTSAAPLADRPTETQTGQQSAEAPEMPSFLNVPTDDDSDDEPGLSIAEDLDATPVKEHETETSHNALAPTLAENSSAAEPETVADGSVASEAPGTLTQGDEPALPAVFGPQSSITVGSWMMAPLVAPTKQSNVVKPDSDDSSDDDADLTIDLAAADERKSDDSQLVHAKSASTGTDAEATAGADFASLPQSDASPEVSHEEPVPSADVSADVSSVQSLSAGAEDRPSLEAQSDVTVDIPSAEKSSEEATPADISSADLSSSGVLPTESPADVPADIPADVPPAESAKNVPSDAPPSEPVAHISAEKPPTEFIPDIPSVKTLPSESRPDIPVDLPSLQSVPDVPTDPADTVLSGSLPDFLSDIPLPVESPPDSLSAPLPSEPALETPSESAHLVPVEVLPEEPTSAPASTTTSEPDGSPLISISSAAGPEVIVADIPRDYGERMESTSAGREIDSAELEDIAAAEPENVADTETPDDTSPPSVHESDEPKPTPTAAPMSQVEEKMIALSDKPNSSPREEAGTDPSTTDLSDEQPSIVEDLPFEGDQQDGSTSNQDADTCPLSHSDDMNAKLGGSSLPAVAEPVQQETENLDEPAEKQIDTPVPQRPADGGAADTETTEAGDTDTLSDGKNTDESTAPADGSPLLASPPADVPLDELMECDTTLDTVNNSAEADVEQTDTEASVEQTDAEASVEQTDTKAAADTSAPSGNQSAHAVKPASGGLALLGSYSDESDSDESDGEQPQSSPPTATTGKHGITYHDHDLSDI